MMDIPPEKEVLEQVVAWGTAHPLIRSLILTSSRTRPDGPVDLLSDYDLLVMVSDVEPFLTDDAWIAAYGRPMVRWGDQAQMAGLLTYFRGVIYQNYVKIDYRICPVELLSCIATATSLPDALDVGYRVLLDKDGQTGRWRPPSYRAHIPAPPTAAEYQALVEEFWWGTTYVAKSLWRGELIFAKWMLDADLKLETMRRLLEWRIEIEQQWELKPGNQGRGLERWLPAATYSDFASTYQGLSPQDTWVALEQVAALFRSVAQEVGDALGYPYPQHVDEQVSAYVKGIRGMPPRP